MPNPSNVTSSVIHTRNGRSIDVFDLYSDDLHVEDIAQGLATSSRWGGFYDLDLTGGNIYSICQHSVLASVSALEDGCSAIEAMCVLHHDDSEAFLKDFPTPIKRNMPEYCTIEQYVQGACYANFVGLPSRAMMEIVHRYDRRMLIAEAAWLGKEVDGKKIVNPDNGALFKAIFPGDCVWSPKDSIRKYVAWHQNLERMLG